MRTAALFVSTILFACGAWAQQHRSTTLPFTAGLSMSAGGVVSQTVGQDGRVHPSCGSLSVKVLRLGDRNVPLKSRDVTDDCKVETKDFGDVLLKINYATFAAQVLVTPQQEEAFKKFLASAPRPPATKATPVGAGTGKASNATAPTSSPLWTVQRAKVVTREKLDSGPLVTVSLSLDDPQGPKGLTYVTAQSPFVVSKSGNPVLWSGWINAYPQTNDVPALWRPVVPASAEIEIRARSQGEGHIDTRAVKQTQMSVKKLASGRILHYVDDNTIEITLYFEVKPEMIADVGIVTYKGECASECANPEHACSECRVKSGIEVARALKAWGASAAK